MIPKADIKPAGNRDPSAFKLGRNALQDVTVRANKHFFWTNSIQQRNSIVSEVFNGPITEHARFLASQFEWNNELAINQYPNPLRRLLKEFQMKYVVKLAAVLLLAGITVTTYAQPPEGRPPREREGFGGEGGRGGRGGFGGRRGGPAGFGGGGRGGPEMLRMFPLFATLDADENGEISSDEIENATAALKKLDRNSDGKLTAEELRPQPRGDREARRQRGNRRSAEAMVQRFMQYDENEDGKISKEETPERLSRMFARLDINEDGDVTAEEITQGAERDGRGEGRGRAGRGGRRGEGPGNRPGRPQRPE